MSEKNISIEFFKKYLQKAKNIQLIGDERPYPFTSIGSKNLKDDLEKMIFDK